MKSTIENIKHNTLEKLKQKLNITSSDALDHSVIGHLTEVLTSLYDSNLEYLEDGLTEQNKFSAQRKKSIFALASQSGYEPSYGTAQQVQIGLSIKTNNINTGSMVIPNYTKLLCTTNGLYYTLVLNNNDNIKTINLINDHRVHKFHLVQGIYQKQTFEYIERPTYTIHLNHIGNIDVTKLKLSFVNSGAIIDKYDTQGGNPNNMGYVIKYSPRGGIDIVIINDKIFNSNNSKNKTIKDGDLIQVEYILHDGSIANFEGNYNDNNFSNINFIFTDTLINPITGLDYNGSDIFDIQTYSQIPGTSPDSLEKVRALIGINSRTEVLTSPEHFKAFLTRFGSVGYSKTWSEPKSMRVFSRIVKNFRSKILEDPSSGNNPNTNYLKLTKSDFILSENEKEDIKKALHNSGQLLAGTLYDILDMDINRYALYVYVKLKNKNNGNGGTTNQDQLSLKNNIENTIINFFIKTDIDGFIGKSEIINEIYENLKDNTIKKHIDSMDIYIISEDLERAKKSGFYDKKEYIYHPIQGYKYVNTKRISIKTGKISETDIRYLGLDKHGNIDTTLTPNKLPILAGGFSWKNSSDQLIYIDPEKPVLVEIN